MELTFGQETFVTFFREGALIAIEVQNNGHIERYSTEKMTRAQSLSLFDVDRVQPQV